MNRTWMKLVIACGILLLSHSAFSAGGVFGFDQEHKKSEAIVHFESWEALAEFNAQPHSDMTVLHVFKSAPALHVKIAANYKGNYQRDLASLPAVKGVEANNVLRIVAQPNDPMYSQQYAHRNIESEKAWELSKGSRAVTVGVIDTGVDYRHSDLKANMWTNPGESGTDENGQDKRTNDVDDDNNGFVDDFRGWDFADNDNDPMDTHGHGTHCAGNIGGVGNNSSGIAGVNWEVSMVGIRFIGDDGAGLEADAVKSIEYATTLGLNLTSNSYGAELPDNEVSIMRVAIEKAGEAGSLFVAAAGNNSTNNDVKPFYPGSFTLANTITVAASNEYDDRAYFSNYGKNTVNVLAPGEGIYSTALNNSYQEMSGTSMAAPIVAGAVALVKGYNPELSMIEAKERLLETVDKIPAMKNKLINGGRINVYRALQDDRN